MIINLLEELVKDIRLLKANIIYLDSNGNLYGTDYNFMTLKHIQTNVKFPFDICLESLMLQSFLSSLDIITRALFETDNAYVLLHTYFKDILINDYRKVKMLNVMSNVKRYLNNEVLYICNNIRSEATFETIFNRASGDGSALYHIKDNIFVPVYKGLINAAKGESIEIRAYSVDYKKYFVHYVVNKKKGRILNTYLMQLYLN